MADRQISIKKLFDLFREVGGNLNDCSKENSADNKNPDTIKYQDWKNKLSLRKHLENGGIYAGNIPTSFVAIDFELLYNHKLGVCSIGMAKYEDGLISNRFYSLICPPFKELDGIVALAPTDKNGGITKEDVLNAPTFADLMPQIEQFIGNLPLVAHHNEMEINCFRVNTAYYHLVPKFDFEHMLDTEKLAKDVEKLMGKSIEGTGTHTLDIVCQRFGIVELTHHHAGCDAEMCGNILARLGRIQRGEETFELIETTSVPQKKKTVTRKQYKKGMEATINEADIPNNFFNGKRIVISGFSVSDHDEYKQRLLNLGASVPTCVSSKTDILVLGHVNPGPKKQEDAAKYGTQVMSEEEFLSIINTLL